MPTVRCPNCQRALKLPESEQGSTARCPLCQTTFPTPAEPPPVPPVRTAPAVDWAAPEAVPRPKSAEPSPFDFSDPADLDTLPVEDREQLQSIAGWLRWYSRLSIAHLLSCGCCNGLAFTDLSWISRQSSIAGLILFLIPQLAALIVIYNGSAALENRRRYGWAFASVFLALLMCVVTIVTPALVFIARFQRPMTVMSSEFWFVSLGLAFLVAIPGIVGGIRGWILLNRPEVAAAFRRR